jgi:acetyl esterase/lipase
VSVLDRAAPPPDLTVPYGPLAEHVVDLRLPRDLPAPLIVLIHGGFWRPAYDRTHLGPMGHALAAAGYVVAVPEYRRAGMAGEGWTGTFDDIARAAGEVSVIPGAGHFDLIDPQSEAWPHVLAALAGTDLAGTEGVTS